MQYRFLHIAGCATVAMIAFQADAATDRRSAPRLEFQKHHPCPANGARRGACPGWIVDHIEPLCAGGQDHPSNMQWQTVEAARLKDNEERARCRLLRKHNAEEILPPFSIQ